MNASIRRLSVATLFLWISFGTASASSLGASLAVRVEDPWIRWLPAGVPAAGYLTLVNSGERSVALVGAESADFGSVTIHRSVAREGVMQMEEVKEIVVSPHSRLDFSASGYHLMLMNPSRPIESAKQIPITLRFRGGASVTIPFEVRTNSAPPHEARMRRLGILRLLVC